MFNVVVFIMGLAVGFVLGVLTIIGIALGYSDKKKSKRRTKKTSKNK